MKKNIALIAMAFAALSLAACDQKQDAQKQEVMTESTEMVVDADGTVTETNTETTYAVDEDGAESITMETETTVDPEGMMNEEIIEETTIEIEESQDAE